MSYGSGYQPFAERPPQEILELHEKSQASIDVVTAVIALLIEELSNPDETKKKLISLIDKYGDANVGVYFQPALQKLLLK